MEIKFANRFPLLETERLRLRQMTAKDAEFVHFMRNDARVNALVTRSRTETVADASLFIDQRNQDFFHKKALYWGVELKTNGFLIGSITLWHLDLEAGTAELGYDIHPDFQRRGFMSEAVLAVLDFGFNGLGFQEINAVTGPENGPSIGLLEKLKFQRVGDEELSEVDQEAGLLGYKITKDR